MRGSKKYILILILYTTTIFAQIDYPKDYFSPPLNIPMQLSGNFGELRANHFHAGFDYKTMQREGQNVYAAADGYVARIKISTFGNGKTLYINHLNGYTTIYAHLQKTTDSIEAYIKKTHYNLRSFEFDIPVEKNKLQVTKGQLIAFSGNTGASEGPHLHFEIRDTQTEKIINPYLFGFDKFIKDTKKPTISALYAYPLGNDNNNVNKSENPVLLNISQQKDGSYIAETVFATGKIGFAIETYDKDDVSNNNNGVYSIVSSLNGNSIFEVAFKTYSFDEMKFINAFLDYPFLVRNKKKVQKLFVERDFDLTILKFDKSKGIISVEPNISNTYQIEVADFFGNKTTITVPIEYRRLTPIIKKPKSTSNYFIKAGKESLFVQDNIDVFFPADALFNDTSLNFKTENDTVFLDKNIIAINNPFTVNITSNKFSSENQQKIFIGTFSGKKILYNETSKKDSTFKIRTKTFGKFALTIDNIPPTIVPRKQIEGKSLSYDKTVQFSISDNLSGIKHYNGFLNGKWILFEYDNKTNIITHYFSDNIAKEGLNNLKLIVEDKAGNTATLETYFFRRKIPNEPFD